ncbi:MAG: hypothetical protein VR69_07810 [Peptococcaceae bacterium BRH_c4b]|nr:MAG: hypothetical protein VR69_07810 [Peptococcaceae bacterium BRH_c4b]
MKSKKLRIGSILLAVVIFAGTMTGLAFAGTDTDKPDRAAMYQSFISNFADNLGVTEDEVTAALEETQLQMIEEAVEEGTLTQEQADQMIEKIESDEGFGIMGFGMGHGGPGGPGGRGGPGGDGKGPGGNSDSAAN